MFYSPWGQNIIRPGIRDYVTEIVWFKYPQLEYKEGKTYGVPQQHHLYCSSRANTITVINVCRWRTIAGTIDAQYMYKPATICHQGVHEHTTGHLQASFYHNISHIIGYQNFPATYYRFYGSQIEVWTFPQEKEGSNEIAQSQKVCYTSASQEDHSQRDPIKAAQSGMFEDIQIITHMR